MRVLVTGGAGYVGSVSVEALVAAGHDVLVLDVLPKGHRDALPADVRLVEGSYGDPATVAPLLASTPVTPSSIARRSLVGESVENPALYYRENVAGGVAFLEARARRACDGSSSAPRPLSRCQRPDPRDAVLAPINPYGETKRTFEGAPGTRLLLAAKREPALLQRRGRVAPKWRGPRPGDPPDPEHPRRSRGACGPHGVRDRLSDAGRDLRPRLPSRGGPGPRHALALEATSPDDPGTAGPNEGGAAALAINLGTGAARSVREVVSAAERVVGHAIPHAIGERRAGDPPVLVQTPAGPARSWDGGLLTATSSRSSAPLGVAPGPPVRLPRLKAAAQRLKAPAPGPTRVPRTPDRSDLATESKPNGLPWH